MKSKTNKKVVEKVINGISVEERKVIYESKVKDVRGQIVDQELNLFFLKNVSNIETKKKLKDLKIERKRIQETGDKEAKVVSKAQVDRMEQRLQQNKLDASTIKQNLAEYQMFVDRLMAKAKREGIILDV